MPGSLIRLLRPRSVAVLGGSWAESVVEQCLGLGFDGPIWPVHPRKQEVHGLPCYRSIAELPGVPDASFVGVNRELSVSVLAELAAMGAGGAVCFASGFDEISARDDTGVSWQQRLVEAAGSMPIIGPNCYGFINYLDGALLWPDQHGGRRLGADEHGVALLMQSSNVAINVTMQRRNLPIAYVTCLGNQAQSDVAAIAEALLEDERVTCIGIYIEGIADIPAFERFAIAARERGKPVVVLKAGRSDAAQAAALSHTASMAGSDAASRAFFRQLGIPTVDTLAALIEALKLLHFVGPLPGREIASMSCSGGEAAIVADAAAATELSFRPLKPAEKKRVEATLSEHVTVSNPLDYHTFIWGDVDAMTATFAAMLACEFDLCLLVLDFPRVDRCDDGAWQCAIDAIVAAKDATGATTVVVSSLVENLSETRAKELIEKGIAPMQGIEELMVAIEVAATVGDNRNYPPPMLWSSAGLREDDTTRLLVQPNEHEAKRALDALGIAVPAGVLVTEVDDLEGLVAQLAFPLVAKISGADHKTERAGVRLGLNDITALKAAVASLINDSQAVLVEEQALQGACEILIGLHRDAVYGPMLTLAAGGVLVEIMDDSVLMRLPVTADDVEAALRRLRIWPLLEGYRGKPRADVAALISVVETLQLLLAPGVADGERPYREIEINPLIVFNDDDGVMAVDALIKY